MISIAFATVVITKPRRRWFRFSLRTFFVLLTAFGVWLGVQVKWVKDREAVLKSNGITTYDPYTLHKEVAPLPWSLRLSGAQPAEILILDVKAFDEFDLDRIQRLFPESHVTFNWQQLHEIYAELSRVRVRQAAALNKLTSPRKLSEEVEQLAREGKQLEQAINTRLERMRNVR